MSELETSTVPERPVSRWQILSVFLRLGLTSFGGPIAHLGYFHQEFVERRRWLDERTYADIVALCQFLPGPASSQVGLAIGMSRGGMLGALLAWIGFTLPSAVLMVVFAFGVDMFAGGSDTGWLRGLKIVAVAVVALAVLGMARSLCPDRERATLAVMSASFLLLSSGTLWQLVVILGGGVAGFFLYADDSTDPESSTLPLSLPKPLAMAALTLFFVLLIGLPGLVRLSDSNALRYVDSFYRSGSLVFGGGHVVLPLLEAEVVDSGWVEPDRFVAGYGAAQAVPGPLFTFSAYLGASMEAAPTGVAGAAMCLLAIFVPAGLLVAGTLPWWESLRRRPTARATLHGVNAAVVGILVAALYDPVWTSAIAGPTDVALALCAFVLLSVWKAPPWLVVVLGAWLGVLVTALGL